jgi:hypothetical protein
MTVGLLDPNAWGGCKDLAAAWLAGVLDLQSLDLGPAPERQRQTLEVDPVLVQLENLEADLERITPPWWEEPEARHLLQPGGMLDCSLALGWMTWDDARLLLAA